MTAMVSDTLFPEAVARATVEADPVRRWLPHPKIPCICMMMPHSWALPREEEAAAETLCLPMYSTPMLMLKAGQNGGEKSGTAQLRILSAHQIRISSPDPTFPPKAQNTGHS